jgi:hypothetical protein
MPVTIDTLGKAFLDAKKSFYDEASGVITVNRSGRQKELGRLSTRVSRLRHAFVRVMVTDQTIPTDQWSDLTRRYTVNHPVIPPLVTATSRELKPPENVV